MTNVDVSQFIYKLYYIKLIQSIYTFYIVFHSQNNILQDNLYNEFKPLYMTVSHDIVHIFTFSASCSICTNKGGLKNPRTGRGYTEIETVMRFRELIQYGRQKDALEWAMQTKLWGHALMLAYKMDSTKHQQVECMNSLVY